VADQGAKWLWTNGAVFVQHHSPAVLRGLVFLGRTEVDRIIIVRVLQGLRRTPLFEARTVASAERGGAKRVPELREGLEPKDPWRPASRDADGDDDDGRDGDDESAIMPPARALRIATLILVPLIATAGTLRGGDEPILGAALPALLILWLIMAIALVARRVPEARRPGQRWIHELCERFDVLTATGESVLWVSAAALIAARLTGWASVSVVGVLGLGTVYLAGAWTSLVAGGDAPWRHAAITRAIFPAAAIEGDLLREEIRWAGMKIPAGMRLFVTGCTTRHGVTTRYAVGAESSLADVRLESELGPAMRGEHRAPPLALWLGDVFGLTRTRAVRHGAASFSVLPRPCAISGVRRLLDTGGDDATARPTQHQPTEGSFRIRAYVPGDDTRRIHWVRSLQANQLVVRLPDEVSLAEPAVRLVLDNDLWGTESLSCRAPGELLDALVRVWLGIGKALSVAGPQVTLVTAAGPGGSVAVVAQPMSARSSEGLRLGARVAWQTACPLATLLAAGPIKQVVVSSRPRRVDAAATFLWVVVPEPAWISPESWAPAKRSVKLPFPSGAIDNRLAQRRHERRRLEQRWRDRTRFSQVVCWNDWTTYSGHYAARPDRGGAALEVIP